MEGVSYFSACQVLTDICSLSQRAESGCPNFEKNMQAVSECAFSDKWTRKETCHLVLLCSVCCAITATQIVGLNVSEHY
jgi:hypothetical protein